MGSGEGARQGAVTDRRSEEAAQYRRLYNGKRWKALRAWQLAREPLCRFCLITEEVTEATVVDHIRKHNGQLDLFYAVDNLQSLCKHHHDSAKQMIDHGHKVVTYGVDGYPIELN
ncbi:HNH endonuclease [Neorhizobium sp. P12A]|uniref:HNH endonuclease n=1 Tax=Neorhizobium sp. P12A TaxID=2268027 RepID=UPI0011ECF01B|nr:HNH endonuclease [Neorhizobium sp. P12A]KAA0689841.1 HNH endonuclease [Neorhizobium sp. P12A]